MQETRLTSPCHDSIPETFRLIVQRLAFRLAAATRRRYRRPGRGRTRSPDKETNSSNGGIRCWGMLSYECWTGEIQGIAVTIV